jgi:hypothetical protein
MHNKKESVRALELEDEILKEAGLGELNFPLTLVIKKK